MPSKSYENTPMNFVLKCAVEATDPAHIEIMRKAMRAEVRGRRVGRAPSWSKIQEMLLAGTPVTSRTMFLSAGYEEAPKKESLSRLNDLLDLCGRVLYHRTYVDGCPVTVFWMPEGKPTVKEVRRPGRPRLRGRTASTGISVTLPALDALEKEASRLGLSRAVCLEQLLRRFLDVRPAAPTTQLIGLRRVGILVNLEVDVIEAFDQAWRELGYPSRSSAACAAIELCGQDADSVRPLIGQSP